MDSGARASQVHCLCRHGWDIWNNTDLSGLWLLGRKLRLGGELLRQLLERTVFESSNSFQSIFHASGLLAAFWFIVWTILVTDDPQHNCWMSHEERTYILAERVEPDEAAKQKRLPLLKMLTSPPVLALITISLANDWGLYMLLTEGPDFLSNVMGKDIATVSLLTSPVIPNINNCYYRLASSVPCPTWEGLAWPRFGVGSRTA